MGFYTDKNVLVTGGTGLIGKPLVDMLMEENSRVRVVSLDHASRANPEAEFMRLDLTRYENCERACEGMDYVFHLAGIKGSPKTARERPAGYFVPMMLFNTNMMEAARNLGVERYLYTSSIGVYSPAEIFYEDDVWKTFPSENDRFAGWAKRMGELQAQIYEVEDKWDKIAIVRPANVYGPHDNFNPANSMVIPSLIKRAFDGEDPFVVWGDGSPIRDFIHSRDVARGMLSAIEVCPGPRMPLNLGSGIGYSIKELVEIISSNLDKKPKVVWDTSKPSGDKMRVMDIARAKEVLGWEPLVSLEEGVRGAMGWYGANKGETEMGYNVFNERGSL
jgi:GDP-L-fucose synthase